MLLQRARKGALRPACVRSSKRPLLQQPQEQQPSNGRRATARLGAHWLLRQQRRVNSRHLAWPHLGWCPASCWLLLRSELRYGGTPWQLLRWQRQQWFWLRLAAWAVLLAGWRTLQRMSPRHRRRCRLRQRARRASRQLRVRRLPLRQLHPLPCTLTILRLHAQHGQQQLLLFGKGQGRQHGAHKRRQGAARCLSGGAAQLQHQCQLRSRPLWQAWSAATPSGRWAVQCLCAAKARLLGHRRQLRPGWLMLTPLARTTATGWQALTADWCCCGCLQNGQQHLGSARVHERRLAHQQLSPPCECKGCALTVRRCCGSVPTAWDTARVGVDAVQSCQPLAAGRKMPHARAVPQHGCVPPPMPELQLRHTLGRLACAASLKQELVADACGGQNCSAAVLMPAQQAPATGEGCKGG